MNKNILSIPRGLRLWDKARRQKTPVSVPVQQSPEPFEAEPSQVTRTPDGDEQQAGEAVPAIVDYRDRDFDVEFGLDLDHGDRDGDHDVLGDRDAHSLDHALGSETVDEAPVEHEQLIPSQPLITDELRIADAPQITEPRSAEPVPAPAAPAIPATSTKPAETTETTETTKPAPTRRVPAQAGQLSPTARRRQIAEELLATVGRTRPIVARDVAERFGSGVDRSQRESARTALNRMVASGLAIRLPDGSFIPADGEAAGVER